jgi:hypothetical protein
MKMIMGFKVAFVATLIILATCHLSAQPSTELVGRWEGVHYYGDTIRLYDGTMVVRASTIDSMRMILTIDKLQNGKFSGKLHEHFYSDPTGVYFNAIVEGFIQDEKVHFASFDLKENKMPSGNRWCKPKATGVLVKRDNLFILNISFESTLTCTIGPAILERKARENQIVPVPPPDLSLSSAAKKDSVVIIESFRRRSRSETSTITVKADSVRINFSDNGIVDGDSISVFVNGRLEAAHISLTRIPHTISVHFEKGSDEIEVAMFAENVGSVPPNTSLMQVLEGSKTHQVYLSSDTRKNAVVKIKRLR